MGEPNQKAEQKNSLIEAFTLVGGNKEVVYRLNHGKVFVTSQGLQGKRELRNFHDSYMKTGEPNLGVGEFVKLNGGVTTYHKSKSVRPALQYPVKWITGHDHKFDRVRDLKFFNEDYSADRPKEPREEETAIICKSKGKYLFEHQRFVTFCLRPFSPVRSLIVNARTGSGKTRIMQAVLENWACYPNLKIVLLPDEEPQARFYNEELAQHSKCYSWFEPVELSSNSLSEEELKSLLTNQDQKKRAVHRVWPTEGQKVNVQFHLQRELVNGVDQFGVFNKKYSQGEIRQGPVLFEHYVAATEKKQPLGCTLVLTVGYFVQLWSDPEALGHSALRQGSKGPTLQGATVLVDEAHLLFDENNENYRELQTILCSEQANIQCLGLFTATPFEKLEDVERYRSVLLDVAEAATAEKLAQTQMVYYHPERPSYPMFNTERVNYVPVTNSTFLEARFAFPHFRRFSVGPRTGAFRYTLWNRYYLFNELQYPAEKLGITKYHAQLLDCKILDLEEHYTQVLSNAQYLTPSGTLHKGKLEQQFQPCYPKLWAVVQNLWPAYESWKGGNFEDRSLVMLNLDSGLLELSVLLTTLKVPWVMLKAENFSELQTGPSFVQFSLPLARPKLEARGGKFLDDELAQYVNTEPSRVAVVLYNSDIPHSTSLFGIRFMHVVDPEHLNFTATSQMLGRINRLCRATRNQKEIYFYPLGQTHLTYAEKLAEKQAWPRFWPL